MFNFRRQPQADEPRRQRGPVIIGVLFLLAACGLAGDFFMQQLWLPLKAVPTVSMAISEFEGVVRGVVTIAELPAVELSPMRGTSVVGRAPASQDFKSDEARESVVKAPPKSAATSEINLEVKPEDYKVSLSPAHWRGKAQLLPSPMPVSQMSGRKGIEIRGGGWMAIDIARSRIIPIELYRGRAHKRPLIEARHLDGSEVVTPANTGFPIVRGIADFRIGGFEVFENPPCLVRFGAVTENEICEITLRSTRIRFHFEPPVLAEGELLNETALSSVSIDTGLGRLVRIGSFNDGFYPIGDPNHDGFPDFYAESVTGADESGVQMLFVSRVSSDSIEYVTYATPFVSAR